MRRAAVLAGGRAWDTVVLGAGPVGLAAALVAARQGRTLVLVRQAPFRLAEPPRVDVVPASFLALLLELGVHPATIGVRELHDTRLVAWEGTEPEVIRGPATAHLERPALERALATVADRTREVEFAAIGAWRAALPPARRVIDATGRRAVSARSRVAPRDPWIAQTFCARGTFATAAQAFRIAAFPDGYAYRLGSGTRILLGIVTAKTLRWRRNPNEIERNLGERGAGWLLAGLPALATMAVGRGGLASTQWSKGEEGGSAVLRVGDAELARDALASQGLAAGISDALHLLAGDAEQAGWRARRREQRERHLLSLAAVVARCHFRRCSAWADYADFLTAHVPAESSKPGLEHHVHETKGRVTREQQL